MILNAVWEIKLSEKISSVVLMIQVLEPIAKLFALNNSYFKPFSVENFWSLLAFSEKNQEGLPKTNELFEISWLYPNWVPLIILPFGKSSEYSISIKLSIPSFSINTERSNL